ncbi:dihydrodipicolinate synthase family protein, partial [Anaerobacillus sp. MEB173]
CVKNQDLVAANAVYDRIFELKHAIYKMDEPSSTSHLRMKEAMYQRGLISSSLARRPVLPLSKEDKEEIRQGLLSVGLIKEDVKA